MGESYSSHNSPTTKDQIKQAKKHIIPFNFDMNFWRLKRISQEIQLPQ